MELTSAAVTSLHGSDGNVPPPAAGWGDAAAAVAAAGVAGALGALAPDAAGWLGGGAPDGLVAPPPPEHPTTTARTAMSKTTREPVWRMRGTSPRRTQPDRVDQDLPAECRRVATVTQ